MMRPKGVRDTKKKQEIPDAQGLANQIIGHGRHLARYGPVAALGHFAEINYD